MIKRFPKLIPYVEGKVYGCFPKRGITEISSYTFGRGSNGAKVEWRENKPFEFALRFQEVAVGQNTTWVCFCATDDPKNIFDMAHKTFSEMLRTATMVNGIIITSFLYERRGNNCSIAPAFLRTKENSEE